MLMVACGAGDNDDPGPLRLATTTSTVGSGLFDVLLPPFEEATGIPVEVTAVGSGAALQLAREGRADAVLVHARSQEERFLEEGWGINRRDVMYNEFIVVGPPDGALSEWHGGDDSVSFLESVATTETPFLSRGDESGTHQREMELWSLAGVRPEGDWYRASGTGMLRTLLQASREKRYTLTDRSTFAFNRAPLALAIAVEGDRRLFNPYGVIAINPVRYPETSYRQAMEFIDFLTGREGQSLIAQYGADRFGTPLFTPLAVPLEQLRGDAQK